MAKRKTNISFKNAEIIFEEDGKITITETTKDNTLTYDLIEELKKFKNVEGITLSIGHDVELPTMDEEED